MIFFIILCLLMIGFQSVIIIGQKRKIEISNKIRIGYEEKCNAFRMKYTILSKLRNTSIVLKNARKIGKPLYIYGGGILGECFIEIIQNEPKIELLRVLESKELEMEIGNSRYLRSDAVVVVTPMFDYGNVLKLLLNFVAIEQIVGIDELL